MHVPRTASPDVPDASAELRTGRNEVLEHPRQLGEGR